MKSAAVSINSRWLLNPNQWQVTPETARLLQHWRHHQFAAFRAGTRLWTHIRGANKEANPELLRIVLKAGDRRRQDDDHGDADRVADRQGTAPPR
jgi:hypothetical protein